MEIRWFDWEAARVERGKNLPHVKQQGCIYFVTFRMHDSVPLELIVKWERERKIYLAQNPPPHSEEQEREVHRLYAYRVEQYVDRGVGSCLLERESVRRHVEEAMLFEDGERYWIGDYVIMPNHIHVLAMLDAGADIEVVCRQWKSVSAHRINEEIGRAGRFWQTESFDHVLRGPEYLEKAREYIRRNPERVAVGRYTLGSGELSRLLDA